MADHKGKHVVTQLKNNYIQLEKSIVNQLFMSSTHHPTTGSYREHIWKTLFESIVPRKFSVAQSVFIIDSNGNTSHEVDLAIYDEQYTPYIFRYGQITYIPIEAVMVVVQCKSTRVNSESVCGWAESVDKLQTSLKSISRVQSGLICGEFDYKFDENQGQFLKDEAKRKMPLTQTSTRPIKILCHLDSTTSGTVKKHFDFVIHSVDSERLKVELISDTEPSSIRYWFKQLNHRNDARYEQIRNELQDDPDHPVLNQELTKYKVFERWGDKEQEISLLTLTFQLNQLMMLINNPIMFPHQAYVEMFNRDYEASEE